MWATRDGHLWVSISGSCWCNQRYTIWICSCGNVEIGTIKTTPSQLPRPYNPMCVRVASCVSTCCSRSGSQRGCLLTSTATSVRFHAECATASTKRMPVDLHGRLQRLLEFPSNNAILESLWSGGWLRWQRCPDDICHGLSNRIATSRFPSCVCKTLVSYSPLQPDGLDIWVVSTVKMAHLWSQRYYLFSIWDHVCHKYTLSGLSVDNVFIHISAFMSPIAQSLIEWDKSIVRTTYFSYFHSTLIT